MPASEILISEPTLQKIITYRQFLYERGIQEAGAHFQKQLQASGIEIENMDLNTFASLLIQSKLPKIFAESGVYHDQRDWTLQEESILGDVTIDVPVTVYNNGGHYSSFKNHETPFTAHLAYVPGALLRSDCSKTTADMNEVVVNNKVDQSYFNTLYERRLLGQLLQINTQAKAADKLAAVTLPGIGTGQFAGNFQGVKKAFRLALEFVLEKHHAKLPLIAIVHYDPYEDDIEQTKNIGHISYRVRPSRNLVTTQQLEYPEGSSEATHTLTSFVAWDQFSWPGNDFWAGSRSTDDGVKAASTNTMQVITGVEGSYHPATGSYKPPKEFRHWVGLVAERNLQFSAPIYMVLVDGQKIALTNIATPIIPKQTQLISDDPVETPPPASKIDYYNAKAPGLKSRSNTSQNQALNLIATPTPETNTANNAYDRLSQTIDTLLNTFEEKIKNFGKHHPGTKVKATALLAQLREQKNLAFTEPSSAKLEAFKNILPKTFAMNRADLEKDLGWGDYLTNLLIEIVNAVTTFLATVFTLGNSKHHGFFNVKKSDASQDAYGLYIDILNNLP